MNDISTTVEVRCDGCNRLLGRQQVFAWLEPLPDRIYQTCQSCLDRAADDDVSLLDQTPEPKEG